MIDQVRVQQRRKRYLHHTEQLLDARPELAASATAKAIAKWDRPATPTSPTSLSSQTLARMFQPPTSAWPLLGLRASVSRTMLNLNGCSAGSASRRLAKKMAEKNRGARVLVVCVELTIVAFRGPVEGYPHTVIGQPAFGDGASAVIVSAADDDALVRPHERPFFQIVSASPTMIPEPMACSPWSSRKAASTVTSSPGSSFL